MPERAADHGQRLHRVFGEVLPDSTTDDRPDRPDEACGRFDDDAHEAYQQDAHERDRWLRDNRPPHYDGSG